MSLASWVSDYYNKQAKDVPKQDAVTHSLRKWCGLSKIAEFDVVKDGMYIEDDISKLPVNHTTCALCHHHNDGARCAGCPLAHYLGDICYASNQPYNVWYYTGDTQPMIDALEAVNKLGPIRRFLYCFKYRWLP